MDGDVVRARHARLLAEQREQRIQPPRDGKVQVAFLRAVGSDGAAVLPAVSGVNDPDGARRGRKRFDALFRQQKSHDGGERGKKRQRRGKQYSFSKNDKQIPFTPQQRMCRGAKLCAYYTGDSPKRKAPLPFFLLLHTMD